LRWNSPICIAMRHSGFLPSRNNECVFCRREQSSELIDDR
jgi:hypothetical protein